MQANITIGMDFVSACATFGGVYCAAFSYLARRCPGLPGPVQLVKRGLTAMQAAGSVLAEVGREAMGEIRDRWPRHLELAKGRW